MRSKTAFILEKLGEATLEASAMFLAFISAGYGASYSKLEYQKGKIKREIEDLISKLDKKTKARYSKLIYKLKKEGLVKEKNQNKKKFFAITAKGREKLRYLIEK